MNARFSEGSVVRTGKKILGLAGLGILALVCAGSGWAQVRPEESESTAARPVVAAPATSPGAQSSSTTTPAHVATGKITQPNVQNSSPNPPARKGQSEGIKVHGHWVIEVRNPDGSLVNRVEFENSIDPGFSIPQDPGQPSITVPGGASLLGGLLTGGAVPAAFGPWAIMLVGPGGLGNLANKTNAPCITLYGPNSPGLGACVLFQGNPIGSGFESCTVAGTGAFCGLSATSSGTGFVLSGNATALQSGEISTVATLFFTANGLNSFTSTVLPDKASGTPCGGANQPPCAVPVVAQQAIAVTVNISFQ